MKTSLVPYVERNWPSIFSNLDRLFEDSLFSYGSCLELETNDKGDYVFSLPLAGFKQDEVSVELENHTLTVRAESKKHGKVYRSLFLSDLIDGEKIQASLKDGMLEVTIPRKEAVKPRKINLLTE